MDGVLGASLPVFLGLTIFLFGGAAFLAGEALADSWRSPWQVLAYSLLMGIGDRFLVYALFGGELLSAWGFVVHAMVIGGIMLLAYRLTLAHRMVSQYPWLFERTGPFSWREKAGVHAGM